MVWLYWSVGGWVDVMMGVGGGDGGDDGDDDGGGDDDVMGGDGGDGVLLMCRLWREHVVV